MGKQVWKVWKQKEWLVKCSISVFSTKKPDKQTLIWWFTGCSGSWNAEVNTTWEWRGGSESGNGECLWQCSGENSVTVSHMCSTSKVFPVWRLSKPWWFPGIRCPWVLSPSFEPTWTCGICSIICHGLGPCMGDHLAELTSSDTSSGTIFRQLPSARSHHPDGETEGEGKTFPDCPQVLASTRAALMATFLLKAVLGSSSKLYLFHYWLIA